MQYVKISLPTWRKIERVLKDVDRLGFGGTVKQYRNTNDTVLVRNDSDLQCQRYNILQISGVAITPENSLSDFQRRPVFTGIVPGDTSGTESQLLICAEPIAPGQIGRAWIDGVITTQIDVTDNDHTYATMKPDDITSLKSDESGPCCILWKESGTGIKWAVIKIGGGSGGGSVRWAFCSENAGDGNMLDCLLDTDITGTPVTVHFTLLNCSDLKDGHLTLTVGTPIPVMQRDKQWWCTIPIEGTEVFND